MNKKGSISAVNAPAGRLDEDKDSYDHRRPSEGRKLMKLVDYGTTMKSTSGPHQPLEVKASTSAGDILHTNSLAARIWDLLDDQKTLHEIAVKIAREFSLPREHAFEEICGYMRLFCEGNRVTVTR